MRSAIIHTRTLPPTQDKDKRVRVRIDDGTLAEYAWDHAYDAPEVHERAARKAVLASNPGAEVTITRKGSDAMGYTFRALIGT